MTYTFDSDIVSDLHKDAYGFRPSETFRDAWREASDAGKQAIWDNLVIAVRMSIEEDERLEKKSIAEFEKLVADTIQNGAKTRRRALEWIMESSGCNGDWEYLCYNHNLPYSYIDSKD